MGVSVGEMRQVKAGCQVPPGRQLPVEQKAQIDVGIDFRAYRPVVGIGKGIVFLPAERSSEIPFLIQGQSSGQAGDARPLESVDRHGRT